MKPEQNIPGRTSGLTVFIAGIALYAVVRTASGAAVYTAVELYRLDPPSSSAYQAVTPQPGYFPSCVGGQQIVGWEPPMAPWAHALLWNNGGTAIDLNPPDFDTSIAYGTDGGHQVGFGFSSTITASNFHALLWSGGPDSVVDLNPPGYTQSIAYGVEAGQQVGIAWQNGGSGHAVVWRGTADSAVDLNPSALGMIGSEAYATDGSRQVGWAGGPTTNNHGHAILWAGTADSAVDLHPARFTSAGLINSAALRVLGDQQVGYAANGATSQLRHAVLWHGTADSAVDLNPTALAGISGSVALDTNGLQQVGEGDVADGVNTHALLWEGTADSAVDLNDLLPSSFTFSAALKVDPDGNILGIALDPSGNNHLIQWLPRRLLGDANLDGTVDFSDLVILARNYGRAGGWVMGDFNGDGSVGFDDLVLLARNYGETLTGSQLAQFDASFRTDVQHAFSEVPEPSTIPWLTLTTALTSRRRRLLIQSRVVREAQR